MSKITRLKIILVGNSSVGKTSIINRYGKDEFSPIFITTIGIDFIHKHANIDGNPVLLHIWDTAGQERFRSITTSYFKGTHGIGFVFDVSNPTSFKDIKYWLNQSKINDANPYCVLIGNKRDLVKKVSDEDIDSLIKEHNLKYYEISAKNDKIDEIEAVFEDFARVTMKKFNMIQPETKTTIKLQDHVTKIKCCNT